MCPSADMLRGARRKGALADDDTVHPPRSPRLVWIIVLGALASLFSLLCLMLVALAPNLIYLPWLRQYVDLTGWQFALLSLPFVSLVLAIVIALLAGLGMRVQTSGRPIRFFYLIVALALVAFNLAIIL